MKAALYARVSTTDQSVEQQFKELHRVALARGYEAIEFRDEGLSGALPENGRPGLQALMEAARRGRIKVVMCWDVSRFGRSVSIVVDLVERLRTYNVQFSTLRDNIDTTTPQGEFQFHVFAGLAQLNRKMSSENTKAKLKLLKDKGVHLGRPMIQVRQKLPPVDPETIRLRAAAGDLTIRELGDLFKVGKSTVARILKDLSHKPPQKTAPYLIGGSH